MKHTHRGFSLNEMLVVMTIATSVLMACTQLVHRVMREQTGAHHDWQMQREIQRLSSVFRQDVWSAVAAEVAPQSLRLQVSAEPAIQYLAESNHVTRIVTTGHEEHVSEFTFPAGTTVQFAQPGSEQVQLVTRRSVGAPPQTRHRPYRILATIGRDHRFVSSDQTLSGDDHVAR